MRSTKFFWLVAIGAMLATICQMAQATIVNVDIDGQYGSGDTEGPPTTYSGTGPAGGTFTSLLVVGPNPQYVATSITVSNPNIGGSGISFSISGVSVNNTYSGGISSSSSSLFDDYLYIGDGGTNFTTSAPFTIGGLTAGTLVDLYFYSPAVNFGSLSITNSYASSSSAPGPSPFNNIQTLKFSGVTVDGSGNVLGALNTAGGVSGGSNYEILSGFTIVTVPEPAGLALAAAGFGLIPMIRRRRCNVRE